MPAAKGKSRDYSAIREHIRHAVRTRDASECWLDWPFKTEYAEGRPGVRFNGRKTGAVHYAYWVLHGSVHSEQLNHSCTNKGCWNPTHVYDGNQKQNTADMLRAGTSKNGTTKLTADQVLVIRERYISGESLVSIAVDFEVTASNVSAVALGKSWKRSDLAPITSKRSGGPARIDTETIQNIRKGSADGMSGRSLARVFAVSESTVSRIVRGVM